MAHRHFFGRLENIPRLLRKPIPVCFADHFLDLANWSLMSASNGSQNSASLKRGKGGRQSYHTGSVRHLFFSHFEPCIIHTVDGKTCHILGARLG